MYKFLSLVLVVVFSWVGWKLGAFIGPVTAYFVSGLFSIGGFIVGWKVNKALTS
jgi:hypothetical protein